MSVRDQLHDYPIPKDWRSALTGAQKLGLVRILGDTVQLTEVGDAVKNILPSHIEEWTHIHKVTGAKGRGVPLVKYHQQCAAVLRILLLQDMMVRMIVEALRTFPNESASLAELAIVSDQLDHASAPIIFLKPEAAVSLMDSRGRIDWNSARGEHYRSRTFYQYKSILRHAGILEATKLGGDTAKGYDPSQDIWQLR